MVGTLFKNDLEHLSVVTFSNYRKSQVEISSIGIVVLRHKMFKKNSSPSLTFFLFYQSVPNRQEADRIGIKLELSGLVVNNDD